MRAFLYYVIQIIPDHATNLFTDHEEIYARLVKAIYRELEREIEWGRVSLKLC